MLDIVPANDDEALLRTQHQGLDHGQAPFLRLEFRLAPLVPLGRRKLLLEGLRIVAIAALAALPVIAGADYFLQRMQFMKCNRMSKQEIKEEYLRTKATRT